MTDDPVEGESIVIRGVKYTVMHPHANGLWWVVESESDSGDPFLRDKKWILSGRAIERQEDSQ